MESPRHSMDKRNLVIIYHLYAYLNISRYRICSKNARCVNSLLYRRLLRAFLLCAYADFLVEYAADAESGEADDIKGNIHRHEKHRCGGHGV